jgi:hypothetical protein
LSDPVGSGFVESLARPGGNMTGLSLMANDLSGKRLGLLKEAVPKLSHVGLLVDLTDSFKERTVNAYQAAAAALGISMSSAELAAPDDVEPVFAKFAEGLEAAAHATRTRRRGNRMSRFKFMGQVTGGVVILVGLTCTATAQQLNYQHGITQSSEQRVRCGRLGCASVTPRAGCRRVLLGGVFAGNNFKVVCDQRK